MGFPYGRKEWEYKTADQKEAAFRHHVDHFLKPHNDEYTATTGNLPPEFRDPVDMEQYAEFMFELQGDESPYSFCI